MRVLTLWAVLMLLLAGAARCTANFYVVVPASAEGQRVAKTLEAATQRAEEAKEARDARK